MIEFIEFIELIEFIGLIEFIELIGLIELMVTRSQVNELVDCAVFFNPKFAIRNPKSKGWILVTGLWLLGACCGVRVAGCVLRGACCGTSYEGGKVGGWEGVKVRRSESRMVRGGLRVFRFWMVRIESIVQRDSW